MSEVDLSQLAVDRTSASEMRMRRHTMTRYVLPGLLIFGFLSLLFWAGRDLMFPPTDVQVIPVLASQAEMRAEGTPLFNAAGWIEPRPTPIRVAALASGVVEKLLVVEDQIVTAGEPVAELVKDDAKLAHDRSIANRKLAEAQLEREQASLTAARTRFEQPVHLEALLAEADSSWAKVNTMLKNLPFETQRAKSQLNYASREYKRNVAAGVGGVSKREIDQAKTEYETAQATLNELRDRESSLQRESDAIGQRRQALDTQLKLLADEKKARDEADAMVKAAEARVEQMKVAEAEAALRLERMTIRAPVDGKVFSLYGQPGAAVGVGIMTSKDAHDGRSIITMYQPKSLQIRVDVRFEDIPKVSLNQPVQIDNPALSDPVVGKVLFISSEADIQKNTLQVKVAIDTEVDFFKPEMLVDVTFLAPKRHHEHEEMKVTQELKLFLPEKVIGDFEGQSFVWVADQSAKVARRTIVTKGRVANGGMVEIETGLDVGSRIIVNGAEDLVDGQRIRVTGEAE